MGKMSRRLARAARRHREAHEPPPLVPFPAAERDLDLGTRLVFRVDEHQVTLEPVPEQSLESPALCRLFGSLAEFVRAHGHCCGEYNDHLGNRVEVDGPGAGNARVVAEIFDKLAEQFRDTSGGGGRGGGGTAPGGLQTSGTEESPLRGNRLLADIGAAWTCVPYDRRAA